MPFLFFSHLPRCRFGTCYFWTEDILSCWYFFFLTHRFCLFFLFFIFPHLPFWRCFGTSNFLFDPPPVLSLRAPLFFLPQDFSRLDQKPAPGSPVWGRASTPAEDGWSLKNGRGSKSNPGKWKHGPKPSFFWWLNEDNIRRDMICKPMLMVMDLLAAQDTDIRKSLPIAKQITL